MTQSALSRIRGIDYTIVIVREMKTMQAFYGEVMRFPLLRQLGDGWIEYRAGSNILALAERSVTIAASEEPAATGSATLQLAFRVSPAEVAQCEEELRQAGVPIHAPTTDQPWGHRTLFFRDPDGNILEIYADI